MKVILSIALICAIVAASTEACDLCGKELVPVCGQEIADATNFQWFDNQCTLEKCYSATFTLTAEENCDPAKRPGHKLF